MSIKRTLISVLIGACLVSSNTASAESLSDMVESMYSSFSTTSASADSYKTASGRQVFSGGAYSVRFKPKDVNVISFRAPHLGVSCNGIDFFAGSLDLMSKDELIQVGRNIAAAATVYAFRLALNSVCASCNSIMTNIQTIVQQFNQLAKMSCNDAVNAMEGMSNLDEKASQNGLNSWIDSKILDTTNTWANNMSEVSDNWLAKMTENSITFGDIATGDPASLRNFTDMGYLIAYNTEVAKAIFSWMSDEEAQKSALWSVLSPQVSKCPDKDNDKADGMACGLPDEKRHRLVDFFVGSTVLAADAGVEKDDYQLQLPGCENTTTVTTNEDDGGYTYTICEYKESSLDDNVKTYTSVYPIGPKFFEDAFGSTGLKSGNAMEADPQKVCESNGKVASINSLFTKMTTINDDTLTDRQASVASLIGSLYTRDLFLLDADGKIAKDSVDVAECGKKADMVSKVLREKIASALVGINPSIDDAIVMIKNDPRWKNGDAVPSLINRLCTLTITDTDVSQIMSAQHSFKLTPSNECKNANERQ